MRALVGLFLFALLAVIFSENRKAIAWGKILRLSAIQCVLAFFFIKTHTASAFFGYLQAGVIVLGQALHQGTSFVFGYVGGGPAPFVLSDQPESLFIFMFQALPMIVLISSLSMLAFYWGILPAILRAISGAAHYVLGVGSALAAGMAAKLFLGQTDAPLVIFPYLSRLTRGELFTLMTAGMATASMTLFALYAFFLKGTLGDQAMSHIVSAAVLNIFSAMILSELVIPCGQEKTQGAVDNPYPVSSATEALAKGALEGWSLMWTIAPLLIVSLAFLFLLETLWSVIMSWLGCQGCSLQSLLGYLCMPLTWLIGLPIDEALSAGSLLSTKILMNEIVALLLISKGSIVLTTKSLALMVYPICGFANVSSMAIQIGAFQKMLPASQGSMVTALVPRALLVGILAGCFSGALVCIINL